MSDIRRAERLAESAKKHDQAHQWRDAEKYYLMAAQELATSSLKAHVEVRRQWDAAAKRAHRLQQLEVDS